MKPSIFIIILTSLTLLNCSNEPRGCDNYRSFEDSGGFRTSRRYVSGNDSIKITNDGRIFIYTKTDSALITREGTFTYEITDIDCYCASGIDDEGNCWMATPIHTGMGTITITKTNDPLCQSKTLNMRFVSMRFVSQAYAYELVVWDNDCLLIRVKVDCEGFFC